MRNATHKTSVGTSIDDNALRRSVAALSNVSETTTERDPSIISVTHSRSAINPAFPPLPKKQPPPPVQREQRSSMDRGRKNTSRPPSTSRELIHTSPSSVVTLGKTEALDIKQGISRLLDMVEELNALPEEIADLREKINILDDSHDTRYQCYEARLDQKLDERLGPFESFLRARQENRKKRHARREIEEAGGSGPRKRRTTTSGRDSSELLNSQFGVTTTTTTSCSFTTTSTSFASTSLSPPVNRSFEDYDAMIYQLQQVTSRLTDVENSAPPSKKRPWEIEIVMIPPSPLIVGAWHDGLGSLEGTQYESSEVQSTPGIIVHPQQIAIPPTSKPAPKSFSQNSKTYRRLRSRGFVRKLYITGPSAREVSLAVEAVFKPLIDWCASFAHNRETSKSPDRECPVSGSPEPGSPTSTSSSQRTVTGPPTIKTSWQPLRKIYKEVVLQYLDEMDLRTPSLWTVDYLKANCMQRSTARRVIYIMPTLMAPQITWADINHLDRFTDETLTTPPPLNSETSAALMRSSKDTERDEEIEDYWGFDIKLDGRAHSHSNNHSNSAATTRGFFAPSNAPTTSPTHRTSTVSPTHYNQTSPSPRIRPPHLNLPDPGVSTSFFSPSFHSFTGFSPGSLDCASLPAGFEPHSVPRSPARNLSSPSHQSSTVAQYQSAKSTRSSRSERDDPRSCDPHCSIPGGSSHAGSTPASGRQSPKKQPQPPQATPPETAPPQQQEQTQSRRELRSRNTQKMNQQHGPVAPHSVQPQPNQHHHHQQPLKLTKSTSSSSAVSSIAGANNHNPIPVPAPITVPDSPPASEPGRILRSTQHQIHHHHRHHTQTTTTRGRYNPHAQRGQRTQSPGSANEMRRTRGGSAAAGRGRGGKATEKGRERVKVKQEVVDEAGRVTPVRRKLRSYDTARTRIEDEEGDDGEQGVGLPRLLEGEEDARYESDE